MKPLLMTAAVMVMVFTAATGAVAQVGVRAPAMPLRDAPQTSPLFTPSPKGAVTGHGWTGTLPNANVADLAREPIGTIHCPMPVFVPDSANQDRMPVSRPDPESVEHMPVAKSGCTNPLGNKTRP